MGLIPSCLHKNVHYTQPQIQGYSGIISPCSHIKKATMAARGGGGGHHVPTQPAPLHCVCTGADWTKNTNVWKICQLGTNGTSLAPWPHQTTPPWLPSSHISKSGVSITQDTALHRPSPSIPAAGTLIHKCVASVQSHSVSSSHDPPQ